MAQRSAAQTVSDTLSDWIAEGRLRPSQKVSEEALAARLGVSRNTVREAFRLLAHDGLLVHRFNRGVFVAGVTSADVQDVYRLRRIVEPGVVRRMTGADVYRLGRVRAALEAGEEALAAGDGVAAGTANMVFHRELVALARSPRLDATMRRLMAELRLVFAVIAQPQELHEPFVARNRALYELLAAGEHARAADYLEGYLADSEALILAAFEDEERSA